MPYTIHFISLGCAKNVVNCEQMMALCRDAGHTLRETPEGADAAVVNLPIFGSPAVFCPAPTRRLLKIFCGCPR